MAKGEHGIASLARIIYCNSRCSYSLECTSHCIALLCTLSFVPLATCICSGLGTTSPQNTCSACTLLICMCPFNEIPKTCRKKNNNNNNSHHTKGFKRMKTTTTKQCCEKKTHWPKRKIDDLHQLPYIHLKWRLGAVFRFIDLRQHKMHLNFHSFVPHNWWARAQVLKTVLHYLLTDHKWFEWKKTKKEKKA